MSEIVVVGSFTALPGKEAEALEACTGLVEPTHAEDGCILYSLHQGAEDAARITFIERWASPEALKAHMGSDHVQAALARVPELFGDGVDIVTYGAVPAGDSAKGSLAGHAA